MGGWRENRAGLRGHLELVSVVLWACACLHGNVIMYVCVTVRDLTIMALSGVCINI